MEKYQALEFAKLDKRYLWEHPNEKIELVFPNGESIECYWRDAVLSTYTWKLHRLYPDLFTLTPKHMIPYPFKRKTFNDCWEKVLRETEAGRELIGMTTKELVTIIMVELNKLYNDSVRYTTAYITSATARDLREIIHHPEMEKIYENTKPTHYSINSAKSKVKHFTLNSKDFKDNRFIRAIKLGINNVDQYLHVVHMRAFTTDIDNNQFTEPVMTGYGRGIHNVLWVAQESRDASIAQLQAKEPVQNSDYLNRRLQLMSSVIRHIYKGDCGTKELIPWYVEEGGLSALIGIYRLDEETDQLVPITKDDTHLVGKTIKIRNAVTCHHLHKYGVCETCLGKVAPQIPVTFSIGHISVQGALGDFVQLSLSAKHLIVSREAITFVLDPVTAKYLEFPSEKDSSSLRLKPSVKRDDKTVEFTFRMEDLKFIGDIANEISADDIQLFTASTIKKLSVTSTIGKSSATDVLMVSDIGRESHLTREFIEYILENHDMLQVVRSNLRINLERWDFTKPIFNIPYKIAGVKDFMSSFKQTIESGMKKNNIDASTAQGISDMMRLCYNIVKECVGIPVTHLGVMIASMLIRSKEDMDYRLPLPGGPREIDTMLNIYARRSLSQAMAYERRLSYFQSPLSFLIPYRPNHPLDALYFPHKMDIYEDVRKAYENGVYPMEILPDFTKKGRDVE